MRRRAVLAAASAIAAGTLIPLSASASVHALSAHNTGSAGYPDTGVVDITGTRGYSETEPSVAVDPADPARFLAGSNRWQQLNSQLPEVGANGAVDTDIYSSGDDGLHWQGGRLDNFGLQTVQNPLGTYSGGLLPPEFDDAGNTITADQDPAFDTRGNAYYEVVGFDLRRADTIVPVWRSTDGGATWKAPSTAFSERNTAIQIDRPWLAIDNAGGSRDGTVYLTWETMFYQTQLPEVFERASTDHGRTWGPVVRVDQGTQKTQQDPRQFPAVGAGGVLYDVYDVAGGQTPYGPQIQPITIELARSGNGGRSFTHRVVDVNAKRMADPDEADSDFYEFIPAMAADPHRAGHVAVAWAQATGRDSSEVLLRTSADGGRTWSPRMVVSGSSGAVPDERDHVAVTYMPNGRVVVGWRDRSCCGGGWGDPFEVMARGVDTAASTPLFGPVVHFTNRPQARITQDRGTAPDEYLGLTASDEQVAMTWSQIGAGGLPDVMFRAIPLTRF
jgi:hypothetical protein